MPEKAGGRGGSLGKVIDSCQGAFSCDSAASTRNVVTYSTGSIEEIIGSCKGDEACQNAAYSGSIKSITGSCLGERSCSSVANKGSIEDIYNSCNGTSACSSAAAGFGRAYGSSIGGVGILNSCNANKTCFDLASVNPSGVGGKNCSGTQVEPYAPSFASLNHLLLLGQTLCLKNA